MKEFDLSLWFQRRRKNDLEAKYEYGHFIGGEQQNLGVFGDDPVRGQERFLGSPPSLGGAVVCCGARRAPRNALEMVPRTRVEEAPAPTLVVPAPAPAPVERDAAVGDGAPRALYVRQADVERFGYTATCPGCYDLQIGRRTTQGGVRAHSEECRRHIASKLMENPLGKARVERAQKRKPSTDLEAVRVADAAVRVAEAVAEPVGMEQHTLERESSANRSAEPLAPVASSSLSSEPIPRDVEMARGQKRQASVGVEELDAGRRG